MTKKDIERWSKILGEPFCMGEWNCLTRYGSTKEKMKAYNKFCFKQKDLAAKCEKMNHERRW